MVCDDLEFKKSAVLNYPQELQNSINTGSCLPDHSIYLEEGFTAMLPRNIRLQPGHGNGTRYILQRMATN